MCFSPLSDSKIQILKKCKKLSPYHSFRRHSTIITDKPMMATDILEDKTFKPSR